MYKQGRARELLRSLVTGIKSRLRQEIDGEQGNVLEDVVCKHRAILARVAWKMTQKWCQWKEDGPVLLPDDTRLYYRKGRTEVVIQEFKPQIRLLRFKGSLCKRESSIGKISPEEFDTTYSYSLALPYTVFIFKFVDGIFIDLKVAFCDRPLRKMRERPLRPYFPNIDSALSVCMGEAFQRDQLVKDDIYQQTTCIVSYFWNSVFRDEWSTHYWDSKHHFENQGDHRLTTLENWQAASFENPLFVIDDVNWFPHDEETFGDVIVRMLHSDSINSQFTEEIYDEFVEEFLDEVRNSLKQAVTTAEDKVSTENFESIQAELLTLVSD